MGQPALQPKVASGAAWAGAPRPELLPGMGRPTGGMQRGVAQRRSEVGGGVVTSPVLDGQLRLIGEGKPLESGIREHMERSFGADFSTVRVHEGPAASAMGALAFTLGETLYFGPGQYDPTTREGIELLGHELTHVLQQREGRVENPYRRGVAIVQDPRLEAEADAMGRRVADEIWARGEGGVRHPTIQPSLKLPEGSLKYGLGALGLGMAVGGVYFFGQYMGWWGGSGKKTPADAAYNRGRSTWKSDDSSIDESFTTTSKGTQDAMHEVSMRNNLTLRQRLADARVNGRRLVQIVDSAHGNTRGVVCVNFARNLRKELFDTEVDIPNKVKTTIRTTSLTDMVETITEANYAPGTALLYGNEGTMHMTTIVGQVDGQTILVEQHPANPTVLFKTLTRGLDEWRLGVALTPPQKYEVDILEIVYDLIGVDPPPS